MAGWLPRQKAVNGPGRSYCIFFGKDRGIVYGFSQLRSEGAAMGRFSSPILFPGEVVMVRTLMCMAKLLTGVGLMAGWGCSHFQVDTFPAPSWNPTPLANPIVTSKEQIYVHPGAQSLRLSRIGLLTMRCPADVPEVGPVFTQIFYRELLAKRPFQEVVLISETYSLMDEALKLAKRHRLDLLLLGEVPY
jgi:hypothetical protein